jgi:hypothetical protein
MGRPRPPVTTESPARDGRARSLERAGRTGALLSCWRSAFTTPLPAEYADQ